MRLHRPRSALSAVVVLAAAACALQAAEPPRPNVLVLTIDTLRADRMSVYGYERPTSPNLDRLMRAGALFTRARTVEPLTARKRIAIRRLDRRCSSVATLLSNNRRLR